MHTLGGSSSSSREEESEEEKGCSVVAVESRWDVSEGRWGERSLLIIEGRDEGGRTLHFLSLEDQLAHTKSQRTTIPLCILRNAPTLFMCTGRLYEYEDDEGERERDIETSTAADFSWRHGSLFLFSFFLVLVVYLLLIEFSHWLALRLNELAGVCDDGSAETE
jgi:hypothetical protein